MFVSSVAKVLAMKILHGKARMISTFKEIQDAFSVYVDEW